MGHACQGSSGCETFKTGVVLVGWNWLVRGLLESLVGSRRKRLKMVGNGVKVGFLKRNGGFDTILSKKVFEREKKLENSILNKFQR